MEEATEIETERVREIQGNGGMRDAERQMERAQKPQSTSDQGLYACPPSVGFCSRFRVIWRGRKKRELSADFKRSAAYSS